jgi:acyl-CoA thioesterase
VAPTSPGGPPAHDPEARPAAGGAPGPDRYRDRYGELLGIEVVEAGEGRARVTLTAGERHANFLGLVHGGAIFSLADAALAAASNSETGITAVATVVTIHLLRACRPGDDLVAEAQREHRGGRLALYRITVVRLPERELVALAEGQVAIVAEASG